MIYSIIFFYSMLFFYLAVSLILVGIFGHYPGVWILNIIAFIIFIPKVLISSIVFLVLFMLFGKNIKNQTFVFLIATTCFTILIRLASKNESSAGFFDLVFFCFFASSIISSIVYFYIIKYYKKMEK